jgi:hypothetical protein
VQYSHVLHLSHASFVQFNHFFTIAHSSMTQTKTGAPSLPGHTGYIHFIRYRFAASQISSIQRCRCSSCGNPSIRFSAQITSIKNGMFLLKNIP